VGGRYFGRCFCAALICVGFFFFVVFVQFGFGPAAGAVEFPVPDADVHTHLGTPLVGCGGRGFAASGVWVCGAVQAGACCGGFGLCFLVVVHSAEAPEVFVAVVVTGGAVVYVAGWL
jgi:hypothetical protein